jgi:hypothetical protein
MAGLAHFRFAAQIVELHDQLSVDSGGLFRHFPLEEFREFLV